MELIKSVS